MRHALTIASKEFKAYFTSPLATVFLIVFLGVLNFWFWTYSEFFNVGVASTRALMTLAPILLLFFVPAVAMRLWAEEKRQGTIEFLLTAPVSDQAVVAGKFLASLAFLTLAIALTAPIALSVASMTEDGQPFDWGPTLGGYAAIVLLGATYLSIGMFISSLTDNQMIAFILGVVVCFALWVIGEPAVVGRAPAALAPILRQVGLGAHFDRISMGVVDSRDLIYYLSVIAFFLFLNVRSLESRSYR